MYTKHSSLWAAALAFSLGTSAFANGDKMFDDADTNKDGKLSPDEHAANAKRMFDFMDVSPTDGRVTAMEMTAFHDKMGKKPNRNVMSAADKIREVDADGDGVLTSTEHQAGARKMFEKMDTNHDGFLTRDETMTGHEKLMKTRS